MMANIQFHKKKKPKIKMVLKGFQSLKDYRAHRYL